MVEEAADEVCDHVGPQCPAGAEIPETQAMFGTPVNIMPR
jgi:hypothetical protein